MNKYKMEEHIVSFIDILGSSQNMKKDPEGTLNIVHNAYEKAIETYKQLYGDLQNEIKVRIFSDNIVVFCKCDKLKVKTAFQVVVLLSAIIQVNFLNSNILVRGGIAKGDFFADDLMMWGNALVEAYKIENSISIYPRIVISPNLIGEIGLFSTKDDKIKDFSKKYILQDNDNMCYINYIYITNALKDPTISRLMFLERATEMIKNSIDNVKIEQKLCWHNNYLLRSIYEKNEEINDSQSEDGNYEKNERYCC